MATGDQGDIFARLKNALPVRWFGAAADAAPILDAVLQGVATALSFVYNLYAYARLQTRIAWATDGWLDMIAADFFGTGLPRKAGESDASYRSRIQSALLREKATRNAIVQALTALTGRAPTIIEPARPADTGAYGVSTSGYGVAGYYGSLNLAYQAFVIAYRPHSAQALAGVAGYGISTGGYSSPSWASYIDLSQVTGGITDADIFAAIDNVKPVGTIVWTTIKN